MQIRALWHYMGLVFCAPARHKRVRHPEVIEYARHDKVHHLLHARRMVIKAGIGRQNHCAAARKLQHIFEVDC